MWVPFNTKIWLYRKPVDFRRGVDGLSMFIADKLRQDPMSGHLFVFRNRQSDKVKILWWNDHGFYLLYKRNEKMKFKFPDINDSSVELKIEQLQWLLTGLDYQKQPLPEPIRATNFF